MWTLRDGKDCFILIDFDLAVPVDKLGRPTGPTARHRTGTLPFMAFELLESMDDIQGSPEDDGSSLQHRVNFDYQSITFVAIRCAMNTVEDDTGHVVHPMAAEYLKDWQEGSYRAMAAVKKDLLRDPRAFFKVPFSPSFRTILPWIAQLVAVFDQGLRKVADLERQRLFANMGQPQPLEPTPYEAETMYGEVTRDNFIARLDTLDKGPTL